MDARQWVLPGYRAGGFFQATGLEQRLLIGNFGPTYSSAPGAPLPYNNGPALFKGGSLDRAAYYFIDDALLLPIPTAGTNTSTCGEPVTLGDCPLPVSSGVTYAWSPTTGLSSSTIANPVLTPSTTPGTYVYTLTVAVPGQSPQVTSVTVTVAGPVTIMASADPPCKGSAFTLTASGGDGHNYTWSPATGLNTTTGQTVIATAIVDITYTVTSGCDTDGSIDVKVQDDCCRYNMVEDPGIIIELPDSDVGNPYTTSPFTGGPGTIYHAENNLYLETDAYVLEPGSVLLMEADARIDVANGAGLYVIGSTITASCADMWDGIYVHPDALQVQTAMEETRSVIEHSLAGVVLEETDQLGVVPYFSFTDTDFRQNLQSIEVRRQLQAANNSDQIERCTFDSLPIAFLNPKTYNSPTDFTYSLRHVAVSGNVYPATIRDNSFANSYFGVEMVYDEEATLALLERNTFRNFWIGGVYGGLDVGPDESRLDLRNNTFIFPTASTLPLSLQTEQVLADHTPNGPRETTGGYMMRGEIRSWRDKFLQLDSTQAITFENYDELLTNWPRQIGLHAPMLPSVQASRFYLLDTGIEVTALPTGDNTDIKENGFANCRVGLWASTGRYDVGNQPALNASCNTFRRDDWRNGTSTGIYLHLPQMGITPVGSSSTTYVWTEIQVRDERTNSSQTYPVRNLFDDGLVNTNGPGNFVAIDNNSPTYTLDYKTFDVYSYDYDTWSAAGVNVNSAGVDVIVGTPAGEPEAPCSADNYPKAGIQQRVTGQGGIQPSSAAIRPRLEQNAPNPCSDRTIVFYQLPTGPINAHLIIRRSTDGRTIQELPLQATSRQRELDLYGYQPGVYFCTLMVNGATANTIRMLVQ